METSFVPECLAWEAHPRLRLVYPPRPLVYGVEFAGLLEDPTFSVGMISGFTRGAMDLTYLVQNFIEAGQFVPGAFRGRLLTWPRAFESGIYCHALRVVFFIPAFVIVVAP